MSIMSQEAKKQNRCVLHWSGGPSSSNAPKQITPYGDVKQILPFPGAGIGMFDGNGDYLTVPNSADFNISANGSFTFKTWYYHISGTPAFIGTCPETAATAGWLINIYQNQLCFCATTGTSSWDICAIASSALTWTTNTWYHIEVSLNVGMLYLFRDGSLLTSSTMTSAISSSRALYIGYDGVQSTTYLNGRISEMQFINGVVGHTTNFTPPKRQLESDSNTKLLLHFNRNDTTFIDSSPSAHTITAYGDAKQLCSPCDSGVASFPGGTSGSGGVLSTPKVSDLLLESNDFTFASYVYLHDYRIETIFAWCYDTGIDGIKLSCLANGTLLLKGSLDGGSSNNLDLVTSNTIIPLRQWVFIALTRFDDVFTIWINGLTAATITVSGSVYNKASTLNYNIGGTGFRYYGFYGYMSDTILINGIALYTEPFTPPTQPFRPDPNTKLLLHMDGVGNAFYDSSDPPSDNGFPILQDGVTITPTGTFTVEKIKDGRNIWKFDGSTNYITISDHASWSMFLNDFTIAGWIKFDSVAANKVIIGQYTNANNQWYLQWTSSNIIQLYGITSSTVQFNFSCPLTAVANTWYHIVVQRSGSSCIMYINSVAQTVTQTTEFSATATDIAAVLSIGKIGTEYQTGNIKDLQIFTKALTMDQISALYQETFIY